MKDQTLDTILRCMCGERIDLGTTKGIHMCHRSPIDIVADVPSRLSIDYCPDCSSYLQESTPRSWLRADPESFDLLIILLRRIHLPRPLHLYDAHFISTAPHSNRHLKIELHLQPQPQAQAPASIIQQLHIVEFTVNHHLCDTCSLGNTNPDHWLAKVQIRQHHVPHRRTFFYLEQLILKHHAAAKAVRIQETHQGVDFVFSNRSHALQFVDFVSCVSPVPPSPADKSLVSQDTNNYHHTFSLQICPICPGDLVRLPPKISRSLGNHGPLVICTKVTNIITLMDPLTLRVEYFDAKEYWRDPFTAFLTSQHLVKYMVLNVEKKQQAAPPQPQPQPQKNIVDAPEYCLAYVEIAKVSDLGKTFTVKTHLGHLLHLGDHALGYDLYGGGGGSGANNISQIDKYKGPLPKAILIKKSYEERRQSRRGKPRAWNLRRLNMEAYESADPEKRSDEYEEFLNDLEENPELRSNISSFPNKDYQPSNMVSTLGDQDIPSVPLEELLADLDINDACRGHLSVNKLRGVDDEDSFWER